MKTLMLTIEDSAADKVIWFLEQLKDTVKIETVKNDPLAQELERRIKEIDDGTAELIPHADVMRRVYAKWEEKCL
ncbi:hypothetical protein [Sulfurimonas sp.]|uniref:hypothetical protein n=1 Tax=Sulfurimonas sp. TaxID=2022749 RepID=UPI0019E57E8F|nr:hypothetical protein [Sulfurimonas sp.]MBE0514286.1 hypothetical protein [Sulfurimonas sp.]